MSLTSLSALSTRLTIQMLRDKFVINHKNKNIKIPFSDLLIFTICRNHNESKDDLQVVFLANERFDNFIVNDEKIDGKFLHTIDIFDEYMFKNKTLDDINPFIFDNKLNFMQIKSEDENCFIVHYVNVNHLSNFCFELEDKWEITI